MWALLSSRLRTWLFLVIAVPAVRAAVRRGALFAARRNPDGVAARWLHRADGLLSRVGRRRRR